AKWQFVQQQEELTAEFSDVLIRPGVFNTLGNDMTLYVRQREERGELQGIVFEDSRNPAAPILILAERGVLREGPQGPQVVVYNGVRQEETAQPGRLQQLSFDRYTIDLSLFSSRSENPVPAVGERTIWQLLFPDEPTDAETMQRYIAEAHAQLSQPLYGLAIPLTLLAILLTGEFNRRGQTRRISGAVVALAVLEAAALGLSDAGNRGWYGVIAMYGIPATATLAALLTLAGLHRYLIAKRPPPLSITGEMAGDATGAV
ncbi:MAG: LptF/LptG family permease, partial [Pseudomonadota bacterium]